MSLMMFMLFEVFCSIVILVGHYFAVHINMIA